MTILRCIKCAHQRNHVMQINGLKSQCKADNKTISMKYDLTFRWITAFYFISFIYFLAVVHTQNALPSQSPLARAMDENHPIFSLSRYNENYLYMFLFTVHHKATFGLHNRKMGLDCNAENGQIRLDNTMRLLVSLSV